MRTGLNVNSKPPTLPGETRTRWTSRPVCDCRAKAWGSIMRWGSPNRPTTSWTRVGFFVQLGRNRLLDAGRDCAKARFRVRGFAAGPALRPYRPAVLRLFRCWFCILPAARMRSGSIAKAEKSQRLARSQRKNRTAWKLSGNS